MGRPRSVRVSDEELRSLYEDEGLSTAQVAMRIGSSAETVRQELRRRGIPLRACANHGARNGAWRGGRIFDRYGYVLVRAPGHPFANAGGYVREHRLVMERVLGRILLPGEVVHHADGDRSNNAPENLELYARNSDHLRSELAGRVPEWTPEGRNRILDGSRKAPVPKWTDERRQKARERMRARWDAGGVARRSEWTAEEREAKRKECLARPRNADGSFQKRHLEHGQPASPRPHRRRKG